MRDRGSAAILVLFAGLAFTLAAGAGLTALSGDLIDAARARSAADAAALAGTTGGRSAAAAMAAANGATLVRWAHVGHDVVVEVRVGSASAAARATNSP